MGDEKSIRNLGRKNMKGRHHLNVMQPDIERGWEDDELN
jgi:hypothetical protein